MFEGCSSLKNLDGLKNWNYGSDYYDNKGFEGMFKNCTSLQKPNGLAYWSVYWCKNFTDMFNGCSSLQNVESLKSWYIDRENANFTGVFDN